MPQVDQQPRIKLIDPLEFDAGYNSASFHSDFIGDQFSSNPETEVFLSGNLGGRLLSKDEYLALQFMRCVEVSQDLEMMPERAREYYTNSDTFKAIFDQSESVTNEEVASRVETFLIDHGEKCRQRLESFEGKIQEYRTKFESSVHKAVQDGKLPNEALENLAMLDHVSFGLFDSPFSRNRPDSFRGAFYDPHRQTVGFNLFLDDDVLEAVFFHEGVHVIAGHTIEDIYGVFHSIKRSGFPQQNMQGSEWLDEAITEHIALSLQHGGFDVIDFEERIRKGIDSSQGMYKTERRVLHTLALDIDLSSVFKVYFTHRKNGSSEYEGALRQLFKQIKGQRLSRWMRQSNEVINRLYAGESPEDIFGPEEE